MNNKEINIEEKYENKNLNKEVLSEQILDSIVSEVKGTIDTKDSDPDWWKMISKKDRYQIGDVVLLNDSNKYAVFCGPAKKEGLVKLNIIKKQLSKGFYNRNWYVSLDNIEIVRKKDKLMSNFICTNDRIYKILNK